MILSYEANSKSQSRRVVARGRVGGGGENGELLFNVISVLQIERILEISCTTL